MNTSFTQSYTYAALLILIGAICFSSKAVIIKLAYQEPIDSLSLLALRMLFSLPLFIGASLYNNQQTTSTISRKDYVSIAAVGITGFYGASYLDFIGLQYISASLERLILYIYPTLVLLISAIFLKKKINRIQFISLIITYIGLAIVFSGKIATSGNPNPLLGGIFVFFAALTYALYLVGSGQLLPRIGTRRFTAYSMIAASIVVLLHFSVSNSSSILGLSYRMYGLAFAMAVFSTFIPTFLISEGIRILGANNASIISAIGPISTIVMAHFILGERLFLQQWIGALIVIGGIVLITLNKKASL